VITNAGFAIILLTDFGAIVAPRLKDKIMYRSS
jgi:hypothetical protein